MKTLLRLFFRPLALVAGFATLAALAQEPPARPADDPAAAPADRPGEPAGEKTAVEAEEPLRRIDEPVTETSARRIERRRSDNNVNTGFPLGDHHVSAGSRWGEVVSVFGSSSVDGEVDGDVVSVFGATRIGPDAKAGGAAVAVFGPLDIQGEIAGEAVSVLGGVTIKGRVAGDAVSVLGDMELGPEAVVNGDLVVVGGRLKRHPDAIIRGDVVHVPILDGFGDAEWLVTWIKRCLILGRPLAFGDHLGWAWAVAASFLALYLLLAAIFPRSIEKCVTTLETRPGYSVVASILTVFLTPVAIVLLAVTVIGAVLVPFVGIALLAAKLFGKAVMLAWIGRRFTGLFSAGPAVHPAFAVLIGGVLVLLLYTVPVFGFLLYKLLTWLGLGVVVYTVALSMQREKARAAATVAGGTPATPIVPPTSPPPAPPVAPESFAASAAPSATIPSPTVVPPAVGRSEGPSPGAAGVASFGGTAPEFVPPVLPPTHAEPVPPQPVVPAATLPRAGFGVRMGALLLDVLLVGLLLGLMNAMLPRVLQLEGPAILPLLAIYGAIMWKIRGTTIGGIVCGLKVVRLDDREVDWATAIVRALSCFLSIAAAGLGFIWIAIDEDRQSWHDKIAGTIVVRVPKGVSLV